MTPQRVGIVRDQWFQQHLAGISENHPENPQRLSSIDWALDKAGIGTRFAVVKPRPATTEELAFIHTPAHIAQMRQLRGQARPLSADTWLSSASVDVAEAAVGATIDLVGGMFHGEWERGLALVRPPGHHATPDEAMGFCFFNNVAIAAESLIRTGARRVAIVDIDVHHGNGTQAAFFDRPDVLFISTHQHPYYPNTGVLAAVGSGAGRGYNINVPLPARCGDPEFAEVHERLIRPVLRQFAPDVVLVSAGFDAHRDDPLGGMRLTDAGYDAIIRGLVTVADECAKGRVALVLEGGYHHGALARGVVNAARALSGEPPWAEPSPVSPAIAPLAETFDLASGNADPALGEGPVLPANGSSPSASGKTALPDPAVAAAFRTAFDAALNAHREFWPILRG